MDSPSTTSNRVQLLAFILVTIAVSPVLMVGVIAYLIKLKVFAPKGVSGTAYEPFTGRALMHDLGMRIDDAGARLIPRLSVTSPPVWALFSWPLCVAVRLTGYQPTMFTYPPDRPATPLSLLALRTEFFDRTLTAALDRVQQVVILGAGWDTRAYNLPSGFAGAVYEVDAPLTQQAKREALAAAGIDAARVTFVPVDFNEGPWLDPLVAQGFDQTLPTYVLWEGVTMYLPTRVIDQTLKIIAGFPPGSAIAFDYLPKELLTTGTGLYGLLGRYAKASISLTYGEHMAEGLPSRPDPRQAIEKVLQTNGLRLTDFEFLSYRDTYSVYGFALAEPETTGTLGSE